jgi:hypothetical protein
MARHAARHAPRHAATRARRAHAARGRTHAARSGAHATRSGAHATRSGAHATRRRAARPAAVIRPVVTTGVLAALVGGSAVALAVTDESANATPLTLAVDSTTTSASAQQSRVMIADSERVARDRAASNSQVAVVAAKNAELERARAKALAKKRKEAEERAAREAERKEIFANAKSDPKAVARLLLPEYGFGEGQWQCLDRLWIGESDWRWWVANSSSGAYGIPQSLPGNKMASVADDWRTNPVTQIKWGLDYIRSSYGTPCNALDQWMARSPHWY